MDNQILIGLLKKKEGDYIALSFTYHPDIMQKVRLLNDRRYDQVNRRWIVSLNELSKVKDLFPDATYTEGLTGYESSMTQAVEIRREQFKENLEGIDLNKPLVNGFLLMQHQKEAVLRQIRVMRQIIALPVGTGKTLIGLTAAMILSQKNGWTIIIVAPVSVMENWDIQAKSLKISQHSYKIYSWAKIPDVPTRPFIFIADECHRSQAGNRSQRGKKFLNLTKSPFCMSFMGLSGTPIKNGRPINLLPLLVAVKHQLSKDVRYYHIRYCSAHQTRFTRWDVNGSAHLKELYEKIQDVLFYRKKSQCLDLPEFTRVFKKCEFTAEAEKVYKDSLREMKKKYLEKVAAGLVVGEAETLVMFGAARRCSSFGKVPSVIDIAEDTLEEEDCIVIYSFYPEVLFKIRDHFKTKGVTLEIIHGGIQQKDREPIKQRFQNGTTKIVCITSAGGEGIDLFRGSTIILVDRPWAPGDCEQIEGRIHRKGQANKCTSIWLQYDEVDSRVDPILAAKQINIEMVLEGKKISNNKNMISNFAKDFINRIKC